ncbi:MAG: MIP family channel protein [Ferruginibacter sp.]
MKKYTAEFIGTFALVFCGTGAVIVNEITLGAITHTGVSITFGLIVMCMIYVIGDISGAHMNPAITLSFAVNRSFPWKQVLPYIVSQLAGAILASVILAFLFPASIGLGATLPVGEFHQSFILEIVITFFLMFTILRVATGSKEQGMFAGIAIGAMVMLMAMFAGPISGASMNPARSLGPALVSGEWHLFWIYITAPFMGALAAVGVNRFLKSQQ